MTSSFPKLRVLSLESSAAAVRLSALNSQLLAEATGHSTLRDEPSGSDSKRRSVWCLNQRR